MKKTFGAYAIGWLAALGLFNLVVFIIPEEAAIFDKFDSLFWIAYVLITLAFVGQLGCTYYVFNTDSLQKTFYSIPILTTCHSTLVAMLIVGGICMSFVPLPTWLGVILCFGVLVYNVIAVVKAVAAAQIVSNIDQQIKVQTFYIKMLTANAQNLLARAASPEMQAVARKAYEAIRYSDPMANDALAYVENSISEHFAALSAAVDANDLTAANTQLNLLLIRLDERNAKCRVLK